MCRVARIDRFLEQWPNAEFGPGHIVLSDCNLEDWHIDFCLREIADAADGDDNDDDAYVFWPGELEATRSFLLELRALPEDQRIETGDSLCTRWWEENENDVPGVTPFGPDTFEPQ